MKSASLMLAEDLTMSVGSRELPDPRPGEALVSVKWAGLCGSDLHVMRSGEWVSEWPATLGHEIFGEVAEIADGSDFRVGDRVVADSRLPCGSCRQCAVDPDLCPNIRFVGEACPGGFAEYCVLPVSSLHGVPDRLDGSVAVLAEPLAVALHAIGRLAQEPTRVAIIGHGPIGALLNIELRRRFPQAQVSVAEPATRRRELAATLGAGAAERSSELSAHAFDLVVDAAGYGDSLVDALELCDFGAELLLVAISAQPVELVPLDLVERRVRITAVNAFVDELGPAIELLAADPERYAAIVTETVALDELPVAAKSQLREPEAVKVLVRPAGENGKGGLDG